MNSRIKELQQSLVHLLQNQYSNWKAMSVELAGSGLEMCVFRVETKAHGILAIRVPWERFSSNDNDMDVDARWLLEKEQLLSSLMYEHGLLVPKPIALHFGDDLDFLATEYVKNDSGDIDGEELGRLIRQVHEVPVPDPHPRIWQGVPLNEHISDRLIRRSQVVERLTGEKFLLPGEQEIMEVLQQGGSSESVIHMDIRPSNILTYDGKVVGLIDWSNSMFGHAALEIARIAEYGHLSDEFLKGYGLNPFEHISKRLELLYRLDTATMLAVVFLSEAPDPELARQQIDRLKELHFFLKKEW